MSWAGSDEALVYLGLNAVGVADSRVASAADVRWLPTGSPLEGWRKAIDQLKPIRRTWRRRRVAVRLSGALARPFILAPVQGLRRWHEAVQVAATLAMEATGLAGPCEVWLDGWSVDRPCLAVAIERELRDAIELTAETAALRLTALEPWWGAALRDAGDRLEAVRLLTVEDTDSLTLLTGSADPGFASAAGYIPRPDAARKEALLTRALFAADLTVDHGLRAVLPHVDLPKGEGTSKPTVALEACLEPLS